MRSSHIFAAFVLAAIGFMSAGCARRTKALSDIGDEASNTIIRDLELADAETVVLEMTKNRGREEAIALAHTKSGYNLYYVVRAADENSSEPDTWKLWMNYETLEDGTGAELPAVKNFSSRPSDQDVAEFKTEVLSHWSNK